MDRSLGLVIPLSSPTEATPFLLPRSLPPPPPLSSLASISLWPCPSALLSPSSRRDVGVIPRRLSSFVNSDSGGSSHPEPNPRENHTKNQETRRPLSSSRRRVSTVGFAAVVLREAAADADSAKQTRGPPRGRRREAERRRETGSRELESGHAR
ncbi:hypothetical protein GW17_00043490 [Ensete ventricosum]|uniref:Uncharacterized protein n=1 Tax=Ensete ventricosum TaxID=4639 RepID=A0A444D786_ENSVE|nr:hypothetical protein GW17_00043490 [Ensete ventricosum]RZR71876.1 hypothetical protein BHM03_00008301 [Ensete ventricosum]